MHKTLNMSFASALEVICKLLVTLGKGHLDLRNLYFNFLKSFIKYNMNL